MNWETVIGLEVHAELSTDSKIFCACTTLFGGDTNTHVCPICSGMPGVLPKLNRSVVEYALRVGLTLDCEITKNCKFDRKNYFYPDLPKAYQVSQLYLPICRGGHLDIEVDGDIKTIGINEIHMEEDAGKLIHDTDSETTFVDFNRCGVPLIEIVSKPDFRSGEEVIAYLEKMREILLYLDVCDCKMQEGSLRADVNLSVRRVDGEFGTRTEMKNLNSFKAIARAIEYERERQIKILEEGERVLQETRRWDDNEGVSFSMRSKENAQDYRYFPEPDLLPISISDEWLTEIKENLPELAHEKRARYIKDYGLSEFEASVITNHVKVSNLFESVSALSGEPVETARLITGEVMRLMNQTSTLPEDLDIDGNKLATLISFVIAGKINRNTYKDVTKEVFMSDTEPEAYIKEKGLLMLTDDSSVIAVVKAVAEKNPDAVADYRSGIEKSFGFLMGQVMKELKGQGNPEMVRKALQDILKG